MKNEIRMPINMLGVIIVMAFVLIPLSIAIIILNTAISMATVFLALMLLSCSVTWTLYCFHKKVLLFTWAVFKPNCIVVKGLFQKEHTIAYTNCKACGIAYYRHAFMNSKNSLLGINACYFYFSCEPFDDRYRFCINLWMPSETRIKVKFNKKLYNYLTEHLPEDQKTMVHNDYEQYCKKE